WRQQITCRPFNLCWSINWRLSPSHGGRNYVLRKLQIIRQFGLARAFAYTQVDRPNQPVSKRRRLQVLEKV
ncbi:hypothetical protein M514_08108, partial [Trichuris suis]